MTTPKRGERGAAVVRRLQTEICFLRGFHLHDRTFAIREAQILARETDQASQAGAAGLLREVKVPRGAWSLAG